MLKLEKLYQKYKIIHLLLYARGIAVRCNEFRFIRFFVYVVCEEYGREFLVSFQPCALFKITFPRSSMGCCGFMIFSPVLSYYYIFLVK